MSIAAVSEQIGNGLILLFLVGIPLYGFFRKVPVYEAFIEGAKEGFPTFIRIMPFMVAMLVAIGMLRASGAFELVSHAISPWLAKIGIPPEVVPIALIRPFSASAATAMAADLLHTQGGNSFLSHLAVIVAATTETTFYIVAIYFGSANIRKYRHAIPASLTVDVIGIVSAIWITSYLLG
jgi:spore maturation protein B